MVKISKIASTALALALSFALVAPISAKAYTLFDTNINETKDANGRILTTTTYTNKATGATYVIKDGWEGDNYYDGWFNPHSTEAPTKQVVVETKKPQTIYISASEFGGSALQGFKTSKKKIAVVKENSVSSTKYAPDAGGRSYIGYQRVTDKDDKTTYTYYYKDSAGNIVTTETLDNIPKNNNASYELLVTGKKPGKCKLNFSVLNADGAVIGQRSVDIVVKADACAIKSVTFASKNVLADTNHDGRADYNKYLYDKKNVINGQEFTTKGSGKVKITLNKGYTLEDVLIGKLGTEACALDPNAEEWEKVSTEKSGTQMLSKVDLNGDGDYLDTINGISESNEDITYNWSSLGKKKAFKLSLSTEGGSFSNTTTHYSYKTSYDPATDKTTYTRDKETSTSINTNKAVLAPTVIRVIYKDTKNNTVDYDDITIWRKAK